MASAGLLLLGVSAVAMTWPRVVAIPLSVMLGWVALSLFFRAATLRFQGKDGDESLSRRGRPVACGFLLENVDKTTARDGRRR